ncbi:adhesion G-protein coupled receptor G6-like isoform X3 [Oratosquilla oratoria]|uniref:adhesion G-protein coupled receptor G6-like isoform X3 n=1 Tax=Oratosquilla oratoria TaxID=337810 RepID=UPI003F7683FD
MDDKLWQTTALMMTMMVLMLGVGPSAQDQSPSTTQANTDCSDGIKPGFDSFLEKFCEDVCPWTTMESCCPSDTTTNDSDPCGDCNRIIIIEDSFNGTIRHTWSSPNYPNDYPEDCNCTFLVILAAHGIFNMTFASNSEIYDASNCSYDRLVFTGYVDDVLCGTAVASREILFFNDDVKYLEMTFISDSGDGNKVATGFEMTFYIHV